MAKPLPVPEGDEYVKVGRSPLHGRGLYAARDIPKGSFIIEYTGEKVTRGEGNRRAEKQWKKGRIYVFRLNQRYDIDGKRRGNAARLINHSCDPNAESQNERGRRIWVVATRDIEAGEEITYDYHLDFEPPPAECLCGSADCIGYMVGPDAYRDLRDWLVENDRPVPANLEKRLRPKRPRTKAGTRQGGNARKQAQRGRKKGSQGAKPGNKGTKKPSQGAKPGNKGTKKPRQGARSKRQATGAQKQTPASARGQKPSRSSTGGAKPRRASP